jgi:hypothetical protein
MLVLFVLAESVYLAPPAPAADEPSSTRTVDVSFCRKYGTALTMDVFKPKHDVNGLGLVDRMQPRQPPPAPLEAAPARAIRARFLA